MSASWPVRAGCILSRIRLYASGCAQVRRFRTISDGPVMRPGVAGLRNHSKE